jgi:FAD/FMN-containing dehydrogenase
MKIWPLQRHRTGAFAAFGTIEEAAQAVVGMLRANLATLVRCECLNGEAMRATNKKFGTTLQEKPTLFLEFQANEIEAALANAHEAQRVCEGLGCTQFSVAEDGTALDELWEARRGCYLASLDYRGEPTDPGRPKDKVYISDTCVPLSRLAECISETEEDFLENDLCPIMCCHVSDLCSC